MREMKQSLRLAWALDPFAKDRALDRKAVAALAALTADIKAEITPISVLPPPLIQFEETEIAIRAEAEKGIAKITGSARLPGLLPSKLIECDSFSLRHAVMTFVERAKSARAEMIVTTTLSKKGTTRFVFGSFAEQLLLQSTVPVFIVKPDAKSPKHLKRILFPTDLTEESIEVLREASRLPAFREAQVTLFHEVDYTNRYSNRVYDASPAFHALVEKDLKERKAKIQDLAERLHAAGVEVEVKLSQRGRRSSDAIVRASRAGYDTVLIGARPHTAITPLLGNNTLSVVRHAPCNVWVIHMPSR